MQRPEGIISSKRRQSLRRLVTLVFTRNWGARSVLANRGGPGDFARVSGSGVVPTIVLTTLLVLLSMGSARAQGSGQLSEQAFRDVLSGRLVPTPAELESFDLNGDGQVDVADLVFFLKASGSLTPIASFAALSSIFTEHSGTVAVGVVFTQPFNGTLHYTVSGDTASEGSDYAASVGTVSVSGEAVEIPVTFLDDSEIEETETLTVRLELDVGYAVQEPVEHTIYINDNDGVWAGVYDAGGGRMGFELILIRSGETFGGTLVGGQSSFLPEGEWAADVTITPDSFRAEINGIPIPAESTALGVSLTRSFVFEAAAGGANVILEWNSVIMGTATESIVPDDPEMQYMARSTEGIFVLSRPAGMLSVPEPPLEAVP